MAKINAVKAIKKVDTIIPIPIFVFFIFFPIFNRFLFLIQDSHQYNFPDIKLSKN